MSDITYWRIKTGEHLYISLITDAFSRKLVGYNVAETKEAIQSISALQIALVALDGLPAHCSSNNRHTVMAGVAYTLPMLFIADFRADGDGKSDFNSAGKIYPLQAGYASV